MAKQTQKQLLAWVAHQLTESSSDASSEQLRRQANEIQQQVDVFNKALGIQPKATESKPAKQRER